MKIKKQMTALACAAVCAAALLSGCASGKQYTEAEYQDNYQKGYDEGYSAGESEGVAKDRAGQVQTMNYETFRALNSQSPYTGVIYIGRAACPYCSLVTDYMRSVTELPLPVYYVSLEPYYNSPYYEDFKAELGISSVPTFIYYKDGAPQYYMKSPVAEGYFDESGQERVDAYNEMTDRIRAFIEGCAKDDPAAVESVWADAEETEAGVSASDSSAETAENETESTAAQGSAESSEMSADGTAAEESAAPESAASEEATETTAE